MIIHNVHFVVSDSACIQLKMEIQTNSIVSGKNSETAKKFGVESYDMVDVKQYITAFMKKLLLQKEKHDKNFLEAHLNPSITKLWKEVFSSLEDKNRKLVNTESGSLIFTLFCPNHHSLLQLQDSGWRIELQGKMDKLMNEFGMKRIN